MAKIERSKFKMENGKWKMGGSLGEVILASREL
jgi:hypothetical protein